MVYTMVYTICREPQNLDLLLLHGIYSSFLVCIMVYFLSKAVIYHGIYCFDLSLLHGIYLFLGVHGMVDLRWYIPG
jgi:hypothetical protein